MRPARLTVVTITFFAVSLCYGGDKFTDSLKADLAKSGEDTARVNTLVALSKAYVTTAPDVTLEYGTQARDLAQKIHFRRGEAYALKFIGMAYYYQAKNVESLDNWLGSLAIFRSIHEKVGIASLLNNIGSLYYNQADDAHALDYYLQSLTLSEELGDKLRVATAMQNVGNTYLRKKGTQQKGIRYLLGALPLFMELKNQTATVTVNTNLGEGYFITGKLDSSQYYYKKALAASKGSEEVATTFILNNLGRSYVSIKNYDLAISYQKQAVALGKKLNAKLYVGKSLLGLGDTYYAKGDIPSALNTYREAEPLLKEVHAQEELKDTYAGLKNAYSKLGNYSKAYQYSDLYASFKDSVYNLETDKKLSGLQFDFDISKKESQINLLTKDQALKDLDLQKQKTTRNAFAIAFALILIIAFVIYRSYRSKVKTNILLDRQKVQIENLMHNILPAEVAAELQAHGQATPRHYDQVSVLFTDFKSFTSLADKMTPQELIEELNGSFMAFDDITEKYQLEKIKTIGDSYMCAGGIPTAHDSHAVNMVKAGLEMQEYIINKNDQRKAMGLPPWELRIGIHVGPVVAGVVGKRKYAYDIWGNTVNVASRMESNGEAGRVNISASTYELIRHEYNCSHRGKISAKNVGEIDMYFVDEPLSVQINSVPGKLAIAG